MKNKKPLYITLLAIDAIVTLGLSVFNIIMLVNIVGKDVQDIIAKGGAIAYLAQNTLVYLLTCVVPLFVLLALNIILLVWYVRKTTKKELPKVDDLTEEEKEALRKELLEEMGQTDDK